MLDVRVGKNVVGAIDRLGAEDGYFFAYHPTWRAGEDVSLSMPFSLAGYPYKNGLHPICQMNLPEGRLRESLERRLRKSMPGFDDLALLEIVGRSQIGRLRFANQLAGIDEVPLESVQALIAYDGAEDLLRDLLERFAGVSGVSGVQPKVLIRDSEHMKVSGDPGRVTVKGATHIVKGWDQSEYPHLAANEYFCMQAARRAGLATPAFSLSANNQFLVLERFDMATDGSYLGFEDFCVLNGLGTREKYDSSYERLAKRIRDFISPQLRAESLETFFRSFVVSCAVRNGDAHLKNFGVLYEASDKPVRLAPAYDIVTTPAYIPQDSMALTLGGSKRWPEGKRLLEFAKLQCNLQPARAMRILDEVAEAVVRTEHDVLQHMREHPGFQAIGEAMLREWRAGVDASCRVPVAKKRTLSGAAAREP